MPINVSQTLKKAAEEKAKPKPLPKIRSKKNIPVKPDVEIITPDYGNVGSNTLVSALWIEYHEASTEQKKLSTAIAQLVREGATTERLKKQYESIESYQPQLQVLRDKINYAEKHGTLPPLPADVPEVHDINALKVKATALTQKRSKLKAKIAKKVAKNPERFVQWEKELAMADMEWEYTERRINELR